MPSGYEPCRCLEVSPAPCVLVIFGATGDLARRKLMPSLFQLHTRDLLHAASRIVGVGRTNLNNDTFRQLVDAAVPDAADRVQRDAFLARCTYVRSDSGDAASFALLKRHLARLDARDAPTPLNRLFYFAVPQSVYQPTIAALAWAGLLHEVAGSGVTSHLLLEKPFGSDLASAATLDAFLRRHVTEDQLFRIDHYLGKETVQNILMLRFANMLFDPVWRASCIDHVQITVAEKLGVEDRAAYYEEAGALRDMFQNHLLEMLALVAMEPPAAYAAREIHAEKLAVIRAIRPFDLDRLEQVVVRAQYGAGHGMIGYRDEPAVARDSQVETYVAMKLLIDTPRWQGVPFYLRSGKRLALRTSRVTLVFKPAKHRLFGEAAPDSLVLTLQPDEGMRLNLQAKQPGPKLCMGELPLSFRYADLGNARDAPDAYARLLLDAMLHDHTLFVRRESIDAAWRLFTPLLNVWRDTPRRHPLRAYAAGSDGPAAAETLLARDKRAWLTR